MSRPAVFAEQSLRPEVAAALREHRADRETLLRSLTEWLRDTPYVRAAWLWGSFGRGEADDLSDLDPWVVVSDAFIGEMGGRLQSFARQTGNYVTGGESPQNGPPGGGFFGSLHEGRHGLLHLDCYWQPVGAVTEVPERAVLFNRLGESLAPPAESPILYLATNANNQASHAPTEEEERIVEGIRFAWLMLSVATKTLARHPDSDMAIMTYPRAGLEDAASLLGLGGLLEPSDWSVPEDTPGKVNLLRSLVDKTARLTEAANTQGWALSPRATACLSRHLRMVEGILS